MRELRPGEKLWECLKCEHQQIGSSKEKQSEARCERCRCPFLLGKQTQSTRVHGAGMGKGADLGLALLMEMGAGASDKNK